MKIRNILISAITLISIGFGFVTAQTTDHQLPKVTILGKSFYYYETLKGETLDDIADRYGWNLEELKKTNTEVSGKPSAGTLLYYPAKSVAQSSKDSKMCTASDRSHIHVVLSGETAYGIAKLYNIPLDSLYSLNPELIKGLKKGDKIQIKQYIAQNQQPSNSETDITNQSSSTTLQSQNKEDKSKLEAGYIYHTVSD